MSRVFAATLGQRPEAITFALDAIMARETVDAVCVIHTDPVGSKIADALESLRAVLHADYAGLQTRLHEVRLNAASPLIDITDQESASAYFQGVYEVLRDIKLRGDAVDLVIAGGRKAMSVYAMQAAALLFDPQDKLWTVLTPETMMRRGVYHARPGERNAVQLVNLPLITARLAPGQSPDSASELVAQISDRRGEFLAKLTPSEREVVETVAQYYLEGNAKVAQVLNKSQRTIENQLAAVYEKLTGFYGRGERVSNKRGLLLDLMLRRG